jgi:hypothetical protein
MYYFEAQSKSYKTNCSFVISTKISAAPRRAGQLKASSLRPLIFNSSFVCDCGFDRIIYTFTGYTLEAVSFHRSSHMFSCLGFSRTTQTLHLIYFLLLFCPFSLPSLDFLFYQLFFLNIVYALVGFLTYFLLSYEYYFYFIAKDRHIYFLSCMRTNTNTRRVALSKLHFDFYTL